MLIESKETLSLVTLRQVNVVSLLLNLSFIVYSYLILSKKEQFPCPAQIIIEKDSFFLRIINALNLTALTLNILWRFNNLNLILVYLSLNIAWILLVMIYLFINLSSSKL